MNFFERLITANSGLSSKRFLSLFAALLLAIIVISSICGKVVPDAIIWGVVSVILGNGGMTLMENKKGGI